MLNSNSTACSWPLQAALTFCQGFPSCDKLVKQTKADQHLQGAAFHTWVEAEDRPLMTHSPPSHLEWTCSAGNRPETQPPRGPETWWCLPACLPACQTNPATAERDKPPTTSQSYKATWSKHVTQWLITPLLSEVYKSCSTLQSADVLLCATANKTLHLLYNKSEPGEYFCSEWICLKFWSGNWVYNYKPNESLGNIAGHFTIQEPVSQLIYVFQYLSLRNINMFFYDICF